MPRCFFLLTLFICCALKSTGQMHIIPEDAARHIGEKVVLCGKIYGGIYMDKKNKAPTFLNMGAPYPDHLVTILIWGADRKNFTYKPEEALREKTVCITGTIINYKGKPEIVVSDEKQVQAE